MDSNSSRFVSSGTCISDTQPRLGADGYVGHCKTVEEAVAETARRNLLWAEEVKKEALEGRTWMPIPGHGNCWFFGLTLPTYTSYCD